jgi:hypothetical protein
VAENPIGHAHVAVASRVHSTDVFAVEVEPMTGIEPAYSAWEADVLPLNYIGAVAWQG